MTPSAESVTYLAVYQKDKFLPRSGFKADPAEFTPGTEQYLSLPQIVEQKLQLREDYIKANLNYLAEFLTDKIDQTCKQPGAHTVNVRFLYSQIVIDDKNYAGSHFGCVEFSSIAHYKKIFQGIQEQYFIYLLNATLQIPNINLRKPLEFTQEKLLINPTVRDYEFILVRLAAKVKTNPQPALKKLQQGLTNQLNNSFNTNIKLIFKNHTVIFEGSFLEMKKLQHNFPADTLKFNAIVKTLGDKRSRYLCQLTDLIPVWLDLFDEQMRLTAKIKTSDNIQATVFAKKSNFTQPQDLKHHTTPIQRVK